jgi:beta-phosphoglucomutase-like phosphatase (HAD superfamily)
MKKIKKIVIFDFDGTLINSPEKEDGMKAWAKKYDKAYPHQGWWGRAESLDLNAFKIKPFAKILNILKDEKKKSDTYVMILTSRMEKLRPEVQAVLDSNHILVDKLDMKKSNKTKGEKLLDYVKLFQDLEEIDVYDDRDTDISSYEETRKSLPKKIKFNIYLAKSGEIELLESQNKLINIINDEIKKII